MMNKEEARLPFYRRWKLLCWLPSIGLLLSLFFGTAAAQVPAVKLIADSSHITIGDFLNARLTVTVPGNMKVLLPTETDSLGNMDLVKPAAIDTQKNGGNLTFIQNYTVSAYDSGHYRLGPQRIIYHDAGGNTDTIFTDTVMITVNTVPVDTTKAIKAIKPPLSVPFTWQEFIPYMIAFLCLLLIVLLLLYFLKRRKKHPPAIRERPRPKDPPHVWAKKELKKLEEEKLWQHDQVKQYYSRLTDILRLYLEYRFGWFALESTTEEIRSSLGDHPMPAAASDNLLSLLSKADLVKFAKQIPLPDNNAAAMTEALLFIDQTIPQESVNQRSGSDLDPGKK